MLLSMTVLRRLGFALIAFASFFLASFPASARAQRTVNVSDAAGLLTALGDAMPGDDIILANGNYPLGDRFSTTAGGTAAMPVTVRSANPLRATIRFGTGGGVTEGFLVRHPNWTFESLSIEGVCSNDNNCEHAWHVVGAADNTVIRGNVAFGFNAQIKGNGTGSPREFPDDVLIEGNELYNPTQRMTGNPVTPIDVVGGRRWIVRANYIHDFAKGLGNGISYAAFFKGNSRDGLFEQNLIVCEQMHTGRTRLGLSFGGGGTSPESVCEGGTCTPEHQGGVMRNNIIVHCPVDVGIYVNACTGCEVLYNTLFDTNGIDFRFASTSVDAVGNLIDSIMRDRDSASSVRMNNLESVSTANFNAWFADPGNLDFGLSDGSSFVDMGMTPTSVPNDFCGNDRDDGNPDIGAVEYDGDGPCDTMMTHLGTGPLPRADAGPGSDAGTRRDAGTGPVDSGTTRRDSGPGPGLDAGPRADGGTSADGGPGGTDDGCGCSAIGAPSGSYAWLFVAALFVARLRRSRRAR